MAPSQHIIAEIWAVSLAYISWSWFKGMLCGRISLRPQGMSLWAYRQVCPSLPARTVRASIEGQPPDGMKMAFEVLGEAECCPLYRTPTAHLHGCMGQAE